MTLEREIANVVAMIPARRNQHRDLRSGGPGDTYDGMEPWQPAIDRVSDKLDSQFKWLLGVYGAGFMVLLAAFGAGFLILMTQIDSKTDRIAGRIDALTAQVATTNERLSRLEGQVSVIKPPP